MTKVSPCHFRTAYVAHNSGHDMSALKEFCDKIVFCSSGYEGEEDLPQVLTDAIKDFDPEKDVVVPVGNVSSNILLGVAIARKAFHLEAGADGIPVPVVQFSAALYANKEYRFREIILGRESSNASQD